MFFVKISNLTNTGNLERIVIDLERVTLVNQEHRRINDVDKEVCSITYDMGGGTVTSFTVDCTLEQFHSFMEYCLSCVQTTPPTLSEFLIATRSPSEWKVGDIVRVIDKNYHLYHELVVLLEKTDYPWIVQPLNEEKTVYYLASDQLEFVRPATQETQSCNGNGKDQSTEE